MANIDTDSMIVAAEVFQDSLNHVLGNLVGESKTSIKEFIVNYLLFHKPYMLVTPEGLPIAIDLVFGKEEYRDFIFNLHFVFFSRYGNGINEVNGLIENLARGLSFYNVSPDNYMPKEINTRLSTESNAFSLLAANKWLVSLVLISLFVNVDNTEFIKATTVKKRVGNE